MPVLALNGDADPQDPPANIDGAHELWPNGLELAVPGQAHDINWQTWQSCTGPLVGSFIARGTVAGLNRSCVATAHGQPFALTLSAIARPVEFASAVNHDVPARVPRNGCPNLRQCRRRHGPGMLS